MTIQTLRGIRVLDLGIATAGASTSAMLADMGAEVIKVEGPTYTDPFREWEGRSSAPDWWNASQQFHATNRNKLGLCVDLKAPEGREIFLKLVETSDAVIENFRVGVMDSLGIGYDVLRRKNPRIVLASISSQGQDGPYASHVSFGSTLEASSGLAALMRYEEGGVPHITGRALNYPDQVVSLFASGAVVSALIGRQRTGQGAWIDLSQREISAFLAGEAVVAAAGGSRQDTYRPGPVGSLEGVFLASDALWVAVTARGQEEIGPIIGAYTKQALAAWIASRTASDAAAILRRAGVAAEVLTTAKSGRDPQSPQGSHAFGMDALGRQVKGLPLRLGGRDRSSYSPAPNLGEHNERITGDILKMPAQMRKVLAEKGVLADRPAGK